MSMDKFFKDFGVIWVFRNDHIWEQWFDNAADRDYWINRVGLVTHPDIVRVTIREGDFEKDLKRVG